MAWGQVAAMVWAVACAGAAAGCERAPDSAPPPLVTTRALGTWEGQGSQTIGFGSDSGRFRVTWEARGEPAGTFRLAVHSAVSGRPIQLITDQRGPGTGSAHVDDDPRQYNLMIDSASLAWAVSVEEFIASRAQ